MAEPILDLTVSEAKLEQLRKDLRGYAGAIDNVLKQAVNEALAYARGRMTRAAAFQLQAKQMYVRKVIDVVKATARRPAGIVSLAKTKRLNLADFGALQTKKGVTFKSGPGQRKLVPGAFGPKIVKLGKQVYKRFGKSRYPIGPLHGVSPWGAMHHSRNLPPITADVRMKFEGYIDRWTKGYCENQDWVNRGGRLAARGAMMRAREAMADKAA